MKNITSHHNKFKREGGKDPTRYLELALMAGELMLKYGGETYRVEDTIVRILSKCGYSSPDCFVTTTGIFAGVADVTLVRRIRERGYNFDKVSRINNLSREFVNGNLSVDQMKEALVAVDDLAPPYPFWLCILASGVACGCFSYLLKAGFAECVGAFAIGMAVQFLSAKLKKLAVPLSNMVAGVLIAIMSILMLRLGFIARLDAVIIGSLMPLLPGVAFTNAIRDILVGDFLSGAARLMDVAIQAVSLAAGVGFVMTSWVVLAGGSF